MAKSKSGGTRAYLRGRIANDVYSVGKDGAGKKQQVVRSLAETVANPQTPAQMRGRIIMSTVMQGVSAACLLVDHSFDGVPTGQPSLSEFIKRNYALIKDDIAAHPVTANTFALNDYQEKGMKPGAWQMSYGVAHLPVAITNPVESLGDCVIKLGTGEATYGTVYDKLGMAADDYFTVVFVDEKNNFGFYRVRLNLGLERSTVITNDNLDALFTIEDPNGNYFMAAFETTSGNSIKLMSETAGLIQSMGVIFTKAVEGGFEHSTCVMKTAASLNDAYETVRDTYPEGSQRFLNGGEL